MRRLLLVTFLLILTPTADYTAFAGNVDSQQPQRPTERYFTLTVDSDPDGATVTFSSLTDELTLNTDGSNRPRTRHLELFNNKDRLRTA